MINFIIFSKDRAAQLDLLLRSISELGWRDSFYTKVIYLASDNAYAEGYHRCEVEHDWVGFQRERGPEGYKPGKQDKAGLQSELNIAMLTKTKIDFTCLSTDDMVFYRHSDGDLTDILADNFKEDCTFSLRLGKNTLIQDYHLQSKQPALNLHISTDRCIKWSPFHYHPFNNYGYPLAVDCHIFHTERLWDWCNRFKWKTTNELESGLQAFRSEVHEMWSYQQSVAVNIPCNSISGITKAGETFPYDTRLLNSNFLLGKRLSLENIMNQEIVGCHQEIELTWEQ